MCLRSSNVQAGKPLGSGLGPKTPQALTLGFRVLGHRPKLQDGFITVDVGRLCSFARIFLDLRHSMERIPNPQVYVPA